MILTDMMESWEQDYTCSYDLYILNCVQASQI